MSSNLENSKDSGVTTDEDYENFINPNKIDPNTRLSQQPHGKQTLYCNRCQMYVEPCSFDGKDKLCPYHQRVAYDEDGATYRQYDEFNDEGEEW